MCPKRSCWPRVDERGIDSMDRHDRRSTGSPRLFPLLRGALISQIFLFPWLILALLERPEAELVQRSRITQSNPPRASLRTQRQSIPTRPQALASVWRDEQPADGVVVGPSQTGPYGLVMGAPKSARVLPTSWIPADPAVAAPFTGSDLLGGTLALRDLERPANHPMAQAERARALRTGDPFSPLPTGYRQPLRLAVDTLQRQASQPQRIEPARLVQLPSRNLQRPVSVPVVLQSDGSVDILSKPDDARVLDDIRQWSARQSPPQKGSVEPAVVQVEPIPTTQPSQSVVAPEPRQATAAPVERIEPPNPPAADAVTGQSLPTGTDSITGVPL